MSEHFSNDEILRCITLLISGKEMSESDKAFISEIDAHAAECPECFDKMQAARLLTVGFLRERSASRRQSDIGSQADIDNSTVDISLLMSILVLRDMATGGLSVIADCNCDTTDVNYTAVGSAAVRDADSSDTHGGSRDLLHAVLEMRADDASVTVRCECMTDTGDILLYVYSGSERRLKLLCGGRTIRPEREDYDPLLKEHITVYRLNPDAAAFRLCYEE